ncbi:MAG: oligosaccharide flippase family protein [Pseudohongiellaceae bacterium]
MSNKPVEAIFRPALILMSGRAIGFIAAFGIPIILVRTFSQEEFGTYKQLFLVFSTLFGIAQAGMAESLYYFLPTDSRKSGRYVFNSLVVLGGLGLISAVALWVLRNQVATLLNNPGLTEYLPYIGIYLLFMLMSVLLEILMTIRKQHLAASATYALTDLFRALLLVTPALVFGQIEWLLIGAAGFAIGRFGVMSIYVGHNFKGELQSDGSRLRRHLGYALPFGLAAAIGQLQLNYHMYAVSYYFDAAVFAIYAVGCLQLPITDFLMTSTCNVMMVNMGEKIRSNDKDAVAAIWLDAVRKLALILFPIVVSLLIVANELIILLYTIDYAESVPIFMVWTVNMLFAALLTDGGLRVFAATRFLILQNIVRLGIIVIFIRFFLDRFGLIGAVYVTLFATVVTKFLALGRLKSLMQVSTAQLLPWKALAGVVAVSVAAALPALLIKMTLQVSVAPLLVVTGLVYCLSYYFLLLICGPMSGEEKQSLVQMTQTPLYRIFRTRKAGKVW